MNIVEQVVAPPIARQTALQRVLRLVIGVFDQHPVRVTHAQARGLGQEQLLPLVAPLRPAAARSLAIHSLTALASAAAGDSALPLSRK